VAIGPGSVVTALCRSDVGNGLLTRQSPLTDEHWCRRVAQIPDIDVLVRVPSIGRGLEHRVRDPRVAFPPGMVRRGAPAYDYADPRRRRWIGGVPDLPICRSVMENHVPVVLLPAR